MTRAHLSLVILVVLASGLFAAPRVVLPAHSVLVGEVCIAVDLSTSCPVAPPLISSPSSFPPQLRLAVLVNSSQPLNSFDVTLLANHSVLKPAGLSAVNSVINQTGASLTIHSRCIGGGGIGCVSGRDTSDTLHYSITSTRLTSTGVTGLLFTAIYNVTGPGTNIPIGFQTGCTLTSISGSNVCIDIESGATLPVPETFQVAKFTDQPYFDLQPSPTASLSVPEGSSDTSLALVLTTVNGFAGNVTLTATISPSGPTVSISPSTIKLNSTIPTGFASVNVTVGSLVPPQNYNLTFTGTSGSLPPNIILVILTVPPKDFSIIANPNALTFNVTSAGTSTITLKSLANFAGNVDLALSASPGLNASLAKTRLHLAQKGMNSTVLTLRSSVAGYYGVNITATSTLTPPHVSHLDIQVQDFTMAATTGTLLVPQSTTSLEAVAFSAGPTGSPVLYNATITVTKVFIDQVTPTGPVGPSTGLSVTCNPLTVTINNTGTSENTRFSNCNVRGIQLGNYTVTVVGVSGSLSHAVTFAVQVLGPDFVLVPSQTVRSLTLGTSVTLNVTMVRVLALNDTLTLSAQFPGGANPPSPPTVSVSTQQIMLNSGSPNATVVVTITASSTAPTGIYSLSFTGHATLSQITHGVTILIVVTTTTSPHDLAVYSVSAGTTSATVGSTVSITIVVQNLGKVSENSTVIAIVGDLNVDQQNVTIAPGANVTVTLSWKTSGFSPGPYLVGGKVLGVPGETVLANNVLRSATPVTLTAANSSLLSTPYFVPTVIGAIIAIVAVAAVLVLLSRRKVSTTQPS